MKSYTDLEQSKELSKILPFESADMIYSPLNMEYPWIWKGKPLMEIDAVPCWSLAALLDLFPCYKESPLFNLTRGGWIPHYTQDWFLTYEDEYHNINIETEASNPVDACYEMIIKLYEQKLL